MKDGVEASGVGLEGGKSVGVAVPLVNDKIKLPLQGEINLSLKKDGLAILLLRIRED